MPTLMPARSGMSQTGNALPSRLAKAVREHYQAHPEALELQARGDVVPPTVANHRERV